MARISLKSAMIVAIIGVAVLVLSIPLPVHPAAGPTGFTMAILGTMVFGGCVWGRLLSRRSTPVPVQACLAALLTLILPFVTFLMAASWIQVFPNHLVTMTVGSIAAMMFFYALGASIPMPRSQN